MSYGTGQQERAEYSIKPTVEEVDADLRECGDAVVARYAEAFDPAEIGGKRWEVLSEKQRRAMRAQNEQARRRNEKERADKRAAEDARGEAQQQARIDAKIADYRAQMRGAFPGNGAQFEAAWPAILQQWQIDTARAQIDSTMAQHRARLNSGF